MITITPEILKAIAPNSRKIQLRTDLAQWMNHWFPEFGIDTPQEIRHFLTQTAHESDSFNTLREYADGSAYEDRKDLGNIHVGDGKKFRGRGPIQNTGRGQYYALGVKAGDPGKFIALPELLETPAWGVWAACVFWESKSLNDAAMLLDGETIQTKKHGPLHPLEYITYRVNGGFNGLEERRKFYERAKKIIQ
jgi:putative chitinase